MATVNSSDRAATSTGTVLPAAWALAIDSLELDCDERAAIDGVLTSIIAIRASKAETPPEPPPQINRLLLTVTEAAEALQVGRTTLYRMFESGELSWVQVGAHRRVTGEELQRYITERTVRCSVSA